MRKLANKCLHTGTTDIPRTSRSTERSTIY